MSLRLGWKSRIWGWCRICSFALFLAPPSLRLRGFAAEPVPWARAPVGGPFGGACAVLNLGSGMVLFGLTFAPNFPCFQPAALIGAHTHGTGSAANTSVSTRGGFWALFCAFYQSKHSPAQQSIALAAIKIIAIKPSSHFKCRIYHCRHFPCSQTIGQALALEGESIYEGLGRIAYGEPTEVLMDDSEAAGLECKHAGAAPLNLELSTALGTFPVVGVGRGC
jgi:hypothetical protein